MKITREFSSPDEWNREVNKYKQGESTEIYARHSYPALEKREHELAKMIGVSDTALFNSGMAAIHTAIEAQELYPGDVVLCGEDTYSQTGKLFEDLKQRGIRVVFIHSDDKKEIYKAIKNFKPRLIIVESVSNAHAMGVSDLKALGEEVNKTNEDYRNNLRPVILLKSVMEKRLPNLEGEEAGKFEAELLKEIDEFLKGQNPFIFRPSVRMLTEKGVQRKDAIKDIAWLVKYIIRNSREKLSVIVDNTLSSPILRNPLGEIEGKNIEMVVVESATKHYQAGQDEITAGIVYTNNEGTLRHIKEKRARVGTYLQPVSEQKIPGNITETMPDIMQRHAHNALVLADFFNKLADRGVGGIKEVSHPNLPMHIQNELVQEIAPEGLVTLFYLRVKNAEEFAKKVKEKAGKRIGIGASFGHPKTWIELLPSDPEGVRIAAGSESEEELKQLIDLVNNALI